MLVESVKVKEYITLVLKRIDPLFFCHSEHREESLSRLLIKTIFHTSPGKELFYPDLFSFLGC